jgi:outer membrane protein with beta-barrel domain
MRSVRALGALTVGFALATASPAFAEWQFVPLVGLTFHANTNAAPVDQVPIGTHPNFGGAVSLLGGGILGVEGIGVFTPNFKGDDPTLNQVLQSSRTLAVMGNVVLTTPRKWTEYSLRPYFSGGLGVMRLSVVTVQNALQSTTNTAGLDLGGGAIGFFTKHTGVRFDLRYYRRLNPGNPQLTTTDEPQLSFWVASVGVVFRR